MIENDGGDLGERNRFNPRQILNAESNRTPCGAPDK